MKVISVFVVAAAVTVTEMHVVKDIVKKVTKLDGSGIMDGAGGG